MVSLEKKDAPKFYYRQFWAPSFLILAKNLHLPIKAGRQPAMTYDDLAIALATWSCVYHTHVSFQVCCFIQQLIQSLTSRENLLYVLRHNALYVVHLGLESGQGISTSSSLSIGKPLLYQREKKQKINYYRNGVRQENTLLQISS